MQQSLRAWVAVTSLSGLGPRTVLRLLQPFQLQPEALLQLSTDHLQRYRLPEQAIAQINAYQQGRWPDQSYLDGIDEWLESPENRLLTIDSDDYPPLLREIADPPLLLYLSGDAGILCMPQLAIVGSRSATRNGINHSAAFARALTDAGITVTSGLALGIDGAAHSAAVALQKPTIAVLGSGLKRIYPRRHQPLARDIIDQGGLLVSEYPLDMAPLAHNFPRRNRIISGLSCGVLVVEASHRSGSLITARTALEQGREVFALPGAINNPQSHGCHSLIREGAVLVESVEQIFEQLGSMLGNYTLAEQQNVEPELKVTQQQAWLLEQIGFEVVSVEELINATELSFAELMPILVSLELNNVIEKTAAGYLRLI